MKSHSLIAILGTASIAHAFQSVAPSNTSLRPNYTSNVFMTSLDMSSTSEEWISLVDGSDVVQKQILCEGSGDIPQKGQTVKIEYKGSIGKSQSTWSVEDVVECWLKNQQGLYDILAKPMEENNVDGAVLFDADTFDEAYVAETLGVANKIQCKKTIMAAKRLRTQGEDFEQGSVFDSSADRGKPFEFVLGKGKAIKSMELLVATMKVGETAKMSCRADYGYGPEGKYFATMIIS